MLKTAVKKLEISKVLIKSSRKNIEEGNGIVLGCVKLPLHTSQ